jgi:hypothetical protein
MCARHQFAESSRGTPLSIADGRVTQMTWMPVIWVTLSPLSSIGLTAARLFAEEKLARAVGLGPLRLLRMRAQSPIGLAVGHSYEFVSPAAPGVPSVPT